MIIIDDKMMFTHFSSEGLKYSAGKRVALHYSAEPFSPVKWETDQIKTNTRNYLQTW